jgi:hypothetical protein
VVLTVAGHWCPRDDHLTDGIGWHGRVQTSVSFCTCDFAARCPVATTPARSGSTATGSVTGRYSASLQTELHTKEANSKHARGQKLSRRRIFGLSGFSTPAAPGYRDTHHADTDCWHEVCHRHFCVVHSPRGHQISFTFVCLVVQGGAAIQHALAVMIC